MQGEGGLFLTHSLESWLTALRVPTFYLAPKKNRSLDGVWLMLKKRILLCQGLSLRNLSRQ